MSHPHSGRTATGLAAAAAMLALSACDSVRPLGPDAARAPVPGPAAPVAPAPPPALATYVAGAAVLPIPPLNSAGTGHGRLGWMEVATLPPLSSYTVRVSGTVTVRPNTAMWCYPWLMHNYGAAGTYYWYGEADWPWQLRVAVRTVLRTGTVVEHPLAIVPGGTDGLTDTLFTRDSASVEVMRDGLIESTNCGLENGQFAIYALQSNQMARVVAYDGGALQLTADRVHIRSGTAVTFTAVDSATSEPVSGEVEWRYLPHQASGSATPCSTPGTNPHCTVLRGSGIMRVSAVVGGRPRSASINITAADTMALTASPDSVHAGQVVTFVPYYNGSAGPAARWRWVGSDGAVVEAPCDAGSFCRYAPNGPGRMWAYESPADGAGQQASVGVTVTPAPKEVVRITPIRDTLPPSVTVPAGSLCTPKMNAPSRRTVRVQVTDAAGAPIASRRVALAVRAVEGDGGHVQTLHASPRPAGELDRGVAATGADGWAVFNYLLPEFSGRIELSASLPDAPGVREDVDTLVVGVRGLVPLPPSAKYYFTGITAMHPASHYGLPKFNAELTRLADSTRAGRGGFTIGFNDVSLPLGGRFDVGAKGAQGGRWMDSPSHCSHRRGDAVDLHTNTLTEDQRKRTLQVWVVFLKHSKVDEGDHYHLKLPPDQK